MDPLAVLSAYVLMGIFTGGVAVGSLGKRAGDMPAAVVMMAAFWPPALAFMLGLWVGCAAVKGDRDG